MGRAQASNRPAVDSVLREAGGFAKQPILQHSLEATFIYREVKSLIGKRVAVDLSPLHIPFKPYPGRQYL